MLAVKVLAAKYPLLRAIYTRAVAICPSMVYNLLVMEGAGGKIKLILRRAGNTFLPVFALACAAGALCGAVVCLFNMGAEYLIENSAKIYDWVYAHPAYVPLLFVALAALALIVALVHSRVPEVRGSGVPQTEGVMRGFFSFRKLRVFLSTILLSYISFFAGLPLGSEGPSIQIGATAAGGVAQGAGLRVSLHRYLISAGAGAGLAVAFNAPLTGLVFVLEEGQKKFTASVFFVSASAIAVATLVYRALRSAVFGSFSGHVFFDMAGIKADVSDWNIYWIMLVLGIAAGLVAVLFNVMLIRSQKLTDKWGKRFPYPVRLLIAFLVTGAVGLIPAVKGAIFGGSALIKDLYENADMAWYIIMGVLLIKLVLVTLCYDSGATGGLFVPMLAMGALVGALVGKALIACGVSEEYYPMLVCVGMTAFFAAGVRTPVTAAVLIIEVSGFSFDMLPALIAVFAAFAAAQLCGNKPIYDSMLERFLHINRLNVKNTVHTLEVDVQKGSFADGKRPSEIMWKPECKVLGVYRDEKLDTGDFVIRGGDVLVLEVSSDCLDEEYKYLFDLVKR